MSAEVWAILLGSLAAVLAVALTVISFVGAAALNGFGERLGHIEAMIGNGKPGVFVRRDVYDERQALILTRIEGLERIK